jgi:hypothetical protein
VDNLRHAANPSFCNFLSQAKDRRSSVSVTSLSNIEINIDQPRFQCLLQFHFSTDCEVTRRARRHVQGKDFFLARFNRALPSLSSPKTTARGLSLYPALRIRTTHGRTLSIPLTIVFFCGIYNMALSHVLLNRGRLWAPGGPAMEMANRSPESPHLKPVGFNLSTKAC